MTNSRNNIWLLLTITACALSVYGCSADEEEGANENIVVSSSIDVPTCPEEQIPYALLIGDDDEVVSYRCVPRICHGRLERDGKGDCEEAPDKKEVSTSVVGFATPTPRVRFDTDSNLNGSRNVSATLWPARDYAWEFDVDVSLVDELMSDDLQFKVWIEDVFDVEESGSNITREYKAFRCVATGFTLDTDEEPVRVIGSTARYKVKFNSAISRDCEGAAYELSVSRIKSKIGSGKISAYKWSNLHVSYDMDDQTVWHKNATTVDNIVNQEPECAVNPQRFYYDSPSGFYRLSEFYSQRKTGPSVPVKIPFSFKGRKARIVPGSVQPRSDITIRANSPVNAQLTIDFDYSVENLNAAHLFNPFKPISAFDAIKDEKGRLLPRPAIPGAALKTHNIKDANYAPKDLRTKLYLVPKDHNITSLNTIASDYDQFLLGEVSLGKEKSTATTQDINDVETSTVISETFNQTVTPQFKKRFMDSSNPMYIEGRSRAFTVVMCIDSENRNFSPWTSNAPKMKMSLITNVPEGVTNEEDKKNFWAPGLRSAYEFFIDDIDKNELELDEPQRTLLQRSSRDSTLRIPGPSGTQVPVVRSGCRSSRNDIIVTLDRFVYATPPIQPKSYDGGVIERETGDSKSSAKNANKHSVVCEGEGDNDCDEEVQIGGASDGADSRSLYKIQSNSTRQDAAMLSQRASSSATMELMGFQLVDQGEEAADAFGNKPEIVGNTLSVSISPPWEELLPILEETEVDLSAFKTDWKRVSGQDGLAYSVGVKIPVQIGPVPILVTISFTIGAGIGVEFEYTFKSFSKDDTGDDEEDDDRYACLDTQNCAELSENTKNFEEAAEECQEKGGRLAEMSSEAEAFGLIDLKSELEGKGETFPGKVWLGGQTAFRPDDEVCIGKSGGGCPAEQTTELQWNSTQEVVARARGITDQIKNSVIQPVGGSNAALLHGQTLAFNYENASAGQYKPYFPTHHGMYWDSTHSRINVDPASNTNRFVCVYDRADNESFQQISLKVPITISAGIGIEGCVPNLDKLKTLQKKVKIDIGLCLAAELTFIEFALEPSFAYTIRNLSRIVGEEIQRSTRSFATVKAEFGVTLFKAAFSMTVKLGWFTFQWLIAQYEGIELPLDPVTNAPKLVLYEYIFPSIGAWQ